MKNIIKNIIFIFFGCIGFVGLISMAFFGLFKLFSSMSQENAPFQIAGGKNYLLVTILVFVFFLFWQYRTIKNDFKSPNDIVSFIFLISYIVGGIFFFGHMLKYFGVYWFSSLIANGINIFTIEGFRLGEGSGSAGASESFILTLLDSFMAGGAVFGFICASLFIILRIGILTSGLAFCIGLHNYFNGMSFDLSILWNLILETTLSDFWGAVLTVGQLALTFLANKYFGSTNLNQS